jgi:AraC-like DNA-binding protein
LIPSFCFDDPCLYHLVKALQQDLQQPTHQQTSTLYQEHLALALVAYLLEHYACCRIKPLPQPGDLDQAQLRQLTDYIEAYLYEPLQLSVLAELVGLSPLELDQGFHQTTGMPLHGYLQQRYQARAHQLLSHLMAGSVNPPPSDRLTPGQGPEFSATLSTLRLLQQLNHRVLAETGVSLNNNQFRVLSGALAGQSYEEIAWSAQVSAAYLKKVAADLWQWLSPILGQPIRKSNLRTVLESMLH